MTEFGRPAWWCPTAVETWNRYEDAREDDDRAAMLAHLRAYDAHVMACMECRGCGGPMYAGT